MNVNIETNIEEVTKHLTIIQKKQIPFGTILTHIQGNREDLDKSPNNRNTFRNTVCHVLSVFSQLETQHSQKDEKTPSEPF